MNAVMGKKEINQVFAEIVEYVEHLEWELEEAKAEIEKLRQQQLGTESGTVSFNLTWNEMLIEAHQTKKSGGLYKRLYEMIPPQEKIKGNLQGFVIRQFKDEFPQCFSWGELQKMKAAGQLSPREQEIFYAINAFKEVCSRCKWQE